jgi:hypothetical protein
MSATIEIHQWCAGYDAQYEVPSFSGPGSYTVTIGGVTLGHCTCPAFEHWRGDPSDRTCKHIKYVFAHACLHNTQWYEGGDCTLKPSKITSRTIPDSECPRCGGPEIPFKVAV